jgi:ribosome-interacting GTPase 1
LDKLKEEIWKSLDFVTVYLVRPQQNPSYDNPIVMIGGQSLKEVMEKLGSDFAENKKGAIIWGSAAKFPAQEVSLDTKVAEAMQVRFF